MSSIWSTKHSVASDDRFRPDIWSAVMTRGKGTLRGLTRRRQTPGPRPSPTGNRTGRLWFEG